MQFSENPALLKLFFAIFQAILILFVYAFAYTSAIVVHHFYREGLVTLWHFLPIVVVVAGTPYFFYLYRKLFAAEKRMRAIVWSFAVAGIAIVILSVYSVKLAAAFQS